MSKMKNQTMIKGIGKYNRTIINILTYIANIIQSKYHPYWFFLYMYAYYYKINKRRKGYILKTASKSVLKKNCSKYHDLNHTILVNSHNILKCDTLLKLHSHSTEVDAIVYVMPAKIPENVILCSDVLQHNLFKENIIDKTTFYLRDFHDYKVEVASEIELSLIYSASEISNTIIDEIIEAYFALPKLVSRLEIIEINLNYFGQHLLYSNTKINNVESIYFKCRKVILNNKEINDPVYCVIGQTSIRQYINVQSFIPKKSKEVIEISNPLIEANLCPYGLGEDFDALKKSTRPFIGKRKVNVNPIFLIQGSKGCGKEILIKTLASYFGLHLYNINNLDLSASIYAQNEQKIKNSFFSVRMAAPCIVGIFNFENFGKNNEGQFDERIISYFSSELEVLFENNTFPVLLFCCSNETTIPSELQRIFLETFTINAPNDVQREQNLRWIMDTNLIQYSVNLKEIANKTHGFIFEDLKALVYYAQMDAKFKSRALSKRSEITSENFSYALEYMQSNYNESLGAPKVPKVQWDDVGGLTEVKDEIIKTINLPLKHPELLKVSGLKRSGILLFGPPGTGKTLIAKAVATECSLCFLSVKGPELLNMYVGQSEKNVREVFERAREASPCIIFFDELDSLAPNRGMSGDSGGVMDRVVSQLLAEMDGLNESATVFIIGATNRPDLVDPALLRPGRFDKLLYVGPCTDISSKLSVLKALTRKFHLDPNIDLEKVVNSCPTNITGADFYGMCSNAWTSAVRRLITDIEKGTIDSKHISSKDVVVNFNDFQDAINHVKPSISVSDLKYFEHLKMELGSNV